ncbi:MAG: hypothetical protein WA919_04155 [Coleofasciculaceae cyanobacterium]
MPELPQNISSVVLGKVEVGQAIASQCQYRHFWCRNWWCFWRGKGHWWW